MEEFRFAAPPEFIIAGYRPPARRPRTKRGQERFEAHDPVENIQREYDNRTRRNKRSRYLFDGHPQNFDKETSDFLTELEGVRNQAISGSEPPVELRGSATLEDIEAGQEYFRVKQESKDMIKDPSMRLYNLGPTLYPKRFQSMRNFIFRGLDSAVEMRMKTQGMDYPTAVNSLKRDNFPASMYGTNDKGRKQLANDLLYEFQTTRKREAAEKAQGVFEGMPAYSAPLDQNEPDFGSIMTPGV